MKSSTRHCFRAGETLKDRHRQMQVFAMGLCPKVENCLPELQRNMEERFKNLLQKFGPKFDPVMYVDDMKTNTCLANIQLTFFF